MLCKELAGVADLVGQWREATLGGWPNSVVGDPGHTL